MKLVTRQLLLKAKEIIGLTLALSVASTASADPFGGRNQGIEFEGAVYSMSNDFYKNTIVAYGRDENGLLTLLGEYPTGGRGAAFDGGEGLDPLISAYSILLTDDRRHLLAVNAGSNTISSFRIRNDLSLRLVDRARVSGIGPNSIAYRDGVLYVSSIDADGNFTGEPDQEGALSGFRLSPSGRLRPIRRSVRLLENRPSAIQFSPDGRYLVVSSINAGSAALASGSQDEIAVYSVSRSGILSSAPVSAATSTLRDNSEGRNLPSAIGFEVVEDEGHQFVVVTEAREFQANGAPPAFPALQNGSVSTWRLEEHGGLTPINLDVQAGAGFTFFDGERTACWIEFSKDGNFFWVANAVDSSLSAYTFDQGNINLLDVTVATGTQPVALPGAPGPEQAAAAFGATDGWIDLWASDNGDYVYQLFGLDGTIGVFKVLEDGYSLREIQQVSDLPEINTQGIVAF